MSQSNQVQKTYRDIDFRSLFTADQIIRTKDFSAQVSGVAYHSDLDGGVDWVQWEDYTWALWVEPIIYPRDQLTISQILFD